MLSILKFRFDKKYCHWIESFCIIKYFFFNILKVALQFLLYVVLIFKKFFNIKLDLNCK